MIHHSFSSVVSEFCWDWFSVSGGFWETCCIMDRCMVWWAAAGFRTLSAFLKIVISCNRRNADQCHTVAGLQISFKLGGRKWPMEQKLMGHFLKWWTQAYQTNHSWHLGSKLYLHTDTDFCMHICILTADYTVKHVLRGHSKKKTNYRLMQIKSIAECSNFDRH